MVIFLQTAASSAPTVQEVDEEEEEDEPELEPEEETDHSDDENDEQVKNQQESIFTLSNSLYFLLVLLVHVCLFVQMVGWFGG
jgi:hypothetical protein